MWTDLALMVLLGTGFYYFVEYRDWMNWKEPYIYKVRPGPCKLVSDSGGSEDLTHIGDGVVLISSGYSLLGENGAVKRLNLNTSQLVTMTIRNKPDREDFLASIHGITTWREPSTGQLFLYALTHPKKEDRVEVFEMTGPTQLTYIRTITDPSFTYMNDLVAVGKDKFYITKFWQSRDKNMQSMEMVLRRKTGAVLYYDGKKARSVVSDLQMPNGINVSPDGKMVYLAECSAKKLHGFRRDSTNNLQKAWEIYADTIVDNIEVDPNTGDLYIGCHPVTYRILDSIWPNLGYTHPSQVLRFKIRDHVVSEIEEIFADDSSEIQGSTAATLADGKLVIGTVREETMVCDVMYLSK